ncbi:MAG: SulP family inorganic anion transporter, partial [Lachnospiraceae bacterium]|nr:SulP family inorganic anion transporter [Lachnospiraceae bacterium]
IVLVATFVLTVVFDLVVAIEVGMIITFVLFVKRMSDETLVKGWKLVEDENDPDSITLRKVPKDTMVYEISGPMFFGAADKILGITVEDKMENLILRMRSVNAIDATALNSLSTLAKNCKKNNVRLIFSHVNEQPLQAMKKSGLFNEVGEENFCVHIDDALKRAEEA